MYHGGNSGVILHFQMENKSKIKCFLTIWLYGTLNSSLVSYHQYLGSSWVKLLWNHYCKVRNIYRLHNCSEFEEQKLQTVCFWNDRDSSSVSSSSWLSVTIETFIWSSPLSWTWEEEILFFRFLSRMDWAAPKEDLFDSFEKIRKKCGSSFKRLFVHLDCFEKEMTNCLMISIHHI